MAPPIRTLFVSPYGWFGGQEVFLRRLLASLDSDFRPRTLLMGEGPFADALRADGRDVMVEALPGRSVVARFPLIARRLARRLRGEGFSVVHANGNKAALLAIPLARRLRVPVVWMKHDHVLDGLATRLIAARCARVVCVTELMASSLPPRLRARTVVVTPGVEVVDAPPVRDTEPLIVAAGRLHPEKGFDSLLEAVSLLEARGVDARIEVIGPNDRSRPEHRGELEAAVGRLGLGGRAQVRGWTEDLGADYDRARVVAIASRPGWGGSPGESAGLVLMEGMARGRPVVGPRIAGVAEVVGPGGTLVEPPDAPRLADALEPYLRDPELAARTGRLGQERIAERFAWPGTVQRMSALYRELAR